MALLSTAHFHHRRAPIQGFSKDSKTIKLSVSRIEGSDERREGAGDGGGEACRVVKAGERRVFFSDIGMKKTYSAYIKLVDNHPTYTHDDGWNNGLG